MVKAFRCIVGGVTRRVIFLDADMTFGADLVHKLLVTAYHPNLCPWADAVGAWCQLLCLPLRISGGDGAPARAVLIPDGPGAP